MRRTVLVVPDWLSQSDSVLRQKLPALQQLAEIGEVFRLAPLPPMITPEAAYLGLGPKEGQMPQGPLTVAALGADPPDRSTHFHLSLMSLQSGVVKPIDLTVPADDLAPIMAQASRLDTKKLTVVLGAGADHGLVWESLGDMRDVPAAEAVDQTLKSVLPDGDGEVALRRFIDDGVNLLAELELNERRVGEGLDPINLLWPWGHGVRVPVPNLTRNRGERANVVTGSLRLAGLARLCSYKPTDRARFGRGLNTRLEFVASTAVSGTLTIALIDALSEFRSAKLLEEAEWFAREFDDRLLAPLLKELAQGPSRITLLAPGVEGGLGLTLSTGSKSEGNLPFDERTLDEAKATTIDLSTAVVRGLSLVV